MQDIIDQIKTINEDCLAQNERLLKALESFFALKSQPKHRKAESLPRQSVVKASMAKTTKTSKLNESTMTIKKNALSVSRCDSCNKISRQRREAERVKARKDRKAQLNRYESNVQRLKKLSQKVIPKVSRTCFDGKKSVIFHFQ